MPKKAVIGLLLIIVLVSLYAYVGGNDTSSGSAPGNTSGGISVNEGESSSGAIKDKLVVGVFTDPIDLNPTFQNDQFSQMVKRQMYETLVIMDQDGNLSPGLATEWEYVDDTTLIIKLRQGVEFHSGGELKATDVLFTFKLMSESDFAELGARHIDLPNCEALDDYTVKVKLTKPFAAQINYFNWPLTAIVSEAGYNKIIGDYSKMSIGTGPYKLVRYVKDSEIVMKAHEDYWEDGKPGIPNLVFRVIPEATTRSLELESGGIDVAMQLSMMDVDRLEANQNMAVLRKPSYQMFYIFFNQKHNKYMRDYNVRKAICMAVDWQAAIPAAFGASGQFAPAYVAEGVEGYIEMTPLPYDPDGARKLLKDSGYADNKIEINMYTSNMETRVKLCEMIQAFMAEIGISMKITTLETAAFYNAYLSSEHDMTMLGYFAMTGEAGKVLPYFQSNNIFNATMTWSNPEFDKLVSEAVVEIDTATRIKKYQQAQNLIYDELVSYPILQNVLLVGTRSNVKGLVLDSSFEAHQFKNVYFE